MQLNKEEQRIQSRAEEIAMQAARLVGINSEGDDWECKFSHAMECLGDFWPWHTMAQRHTQEEIDNLDCDLHETQLGQITGAIHALLGMAVLYEDYQKSLA